MALCRRRYSRRPGHGLVADELATLGRQSRARVDCSERSKKASCTNCPSRSSGISISPTIPTTWPATTPCPGCACTAPRTIGAWRCTSTKCPRCTPRSTWCPACSCRSRPTPTRGQQDEHLRVSRLPADSLSEAERLYLLDNFFMANPDHMIRPYPRYHELYQQRALGGRQRGAGLAALHDPRHARPAMSGTT